MKNIVLYTVSFMTGLLLISSEIISQKPAIDLLPSTHQRIHPEAMLDTGIASDSQIVIVPLHLPLKTDSDNIVKKENWQGENNRKWIDFDSVFQRQDSKNKPLVKRSGNYSIVIKYFNPIKLILNITAFKKK